MIIASRDLISAAMLGLLTALLGIVLMRGVALCEAAFARMKLRPTWRTMTGGVMSG